MDMNLPFGGFGFGKGGSGGGAPAWAIGADLWEDFVRGRGPMPDPTDTHAQTIYAPNAAGVYAPFSANILVRIDLGLQTVPTRTQSVPNPSATGAVAGTPGTVPTGAPWSGTGNGLTRTIVGAGTDGATGLPYVEVRFAGTSSSAFQISLDPYVSGGTVPASSGQTWTGSVILALVGGSFTGVSGANLSVQERDVSNGGTGTTSTSLVALTSTRTRYTATRTLSGGTTTQVTLGIRIDIPISTAIDFTVRIIVPQMEQGAFASSPMVTAGAVNGNQQVLSGLGTQLATGVAGFVQVNMLSPYGVANRFFEFGDGTSSNAFYMYQASATAIAADVFSGGVNQGVLQQTVTNTGPLTIAFVVANNYYTWRVVGQSANTPDTTMPNGYPVMDRFALLSRGFDTSRNSYGYTRKLALDFLTPSDDPATKFAEWFAKAQLAAAA
jgi:hypothetical protein